MEIAFDGVLSYRLLSEGITSMDGIGFVLLGSLGAAGCRSAPHRAAIRYYRDDRRGRGFSMRGENDGSCFKVAAATRGSN